jgi:membrane protease YdiL (CAAX protease family)
MAASTPFDRLNFAQLLGGAVLLVFPATILAIVLLRHDPMPRDVVGSFVTYGLGLAWLLWLGHRSGVQWGRLFGVEFAAGHWPLAALALPLIGLTIGVVYLAILALDAIAPELAARILHVGDEPTVTGGWLIGKFAAEALLAPVVEELGFRGFLLHTWARRIGPRRALIATSLLFAVCHYDIVGKFIGAMVLGLVYIRTRSLLIPIAIHALNNAIAFLPWLGEPTGTPALQELRETWYVGPLALALAAVTLIGTARWWRPKAGWVLPYDA